MGITERALGVIAVVLGMTARSDMRRNGVAVAGKVKTAILSNSN